MSQNWEFIVRLLLAGILGSAIGIERKAHFKQAGLRTHFVVAIGSALIMIVSKYGFSDVVNGTSVVVDPSRIAAQIVSGIGFLGAGVIIFQRNAIRGLTTAAGLWTTAGIGMAVGAGAYVIGIVATALVLFGFIVLRPLERKLIRNVHLVVLTADDKPGLIGHIGNRIERLGATIEQIAIDRTDEDISVVQIELHLRYPKSAISNEMVGAHLFDLDGVRQVQFPSDM